MIHGLYRVEYKGICAGFVAENGRIVACAPILKKKMSFWIKIAKRICN